ncbi:serine/threonine protein kinase, partial [Marasmius sp. AFHP31]
MSVSQSAREVQHKGNGIAIVQESQSGYNSSPYSARSSSRIEVNIDDSNSLVANPKDENISKESVIPSCRPMCDAPQQSNGPGSVSEPDEQRGEAKDIESQDCDASTYQVSSRLKGKGRATNSPGLGKISVASDDLHDCGKRGAKQVAANSTKQRSQFFSNARHISIDGSPHFSNVGGNVSNTFHDNTQHTVNVHNHRPDSGTSEKRVIVPITPIYYSESPSCDHHPRHPPSLYQSSHEPLLHPSPLEPTIDPPQYSPVPSEYPAPSPPPRSSDNPVTVPGKCKSTGSGDFHVYFNEVRIRNSALISAPRPHPLMNASPNPRRVFSEATQASLCERCGKRHRIIASGSNAVIRVIQHSSKHNENKHPVMNLVLYRRRAQQSEKKLGEKITADYRAWKALDHCNLVQTFDDLVKENSRYRDYEIMEYVPYTLYALAMTKKTNRAETYCIFRQICDGVEYLHSLGLAHGRLRLRNCLMNWNGVVKIINFDTSTGSPCSGKNSSGAGGDSDLQKVDIWNIGVMFVYLMLPRFLGSFELLDVDFAFCLLPCEARPALSRMLRDRCSLAELLNGRGKGSKYDRIVSGQGPTAKGDSGAGDPWLSGLVTCSLPGVKPGHVHSHLKVATVNAETFRVQASQSRSFDGPQPRSPLFQSSQSPLLPYHDPAIPPTYSNYPPPTSSRYTMPNHHGLGDLQNHPPLRGEMSSGPPMSQWQGEPRVHYSDTSFAHPTFSDFNQHNTMKPPSLRPGQQDLAPCHEGYSSVYPRLAHIDELLTRPLSFQALARASGNA